MREETTAWQTHAYVREHFRPGERITSSQIHKAMPYLSFSAVSSACWKMEKLGMLWFVNKRKGSNIYEVTKEVMKDWPAGRRKAPCEHTRRVKRGTVKHNRRKEVVPSRVSVLDELAQLSEDVLNLALRVERIRNHLIEGIKDGT